MTETGVFYFRVYYFCMNEFTFLFYFFNQFGYFQSHFFNHLINFTL